MMTLKDVWDTLRPGDFISVVQDGAMISFIAGCYNNKFMLNPELFETGIDRIYHDKDKIMLICTPKVPRTVCGNCAKYSINRFGNGWCRYCEDDVYGIAEACEMFEPCQN